MMVLIIINIIKSMNHYPWDPPSQGLVIDAIKALVPKSDLKQYIHDNAGIKKRL